ncbi:alpha-amylase [Cellulophaga tyrosinoxydans]|uniref:Alpha-amylase n=1 Tax=Cellulophaga tyrosinoxydans TaxID=504486 RepID=A0A1W1Y679_9FLAO|nr:alpha-amylase [Cellulophaga tyrosinoxydans]SMC31644.1 alpha-amylase [Cellulophaga tyrosinoxydans]
MLNTIKFFSLYIITSFSIGLVLLLASCTSNNNDDDKSQEQVSVGQDLSIYLTDKGVMMQGFYWDVEPRFDWWNNLSTKTSNWAQIGVDKLWLPPVSKGQSGGYSMGYDPSDYFDLGEYNQHGTVETRFGSRQELLSLIEVAHSNNIKVIADIVMGHNSGGGLQFNSYRNKDTYTLFNPGNGNASGKFNRSFEDFHPNSIHLKDEEASFFEEQDLCHQQENVQNWFWKNDDSVAKYYKNTIGFDGWRFDYVKSFSPLFVKAWVDEVGGWAVGEFYDGDVTLVRQWILNSGISAFDFPNLFQMRNAFQQRNLRILNNGDALWKTNPEKAVTFVANHDTDREPVISANDKLIAYAFILTHPGYPCIFYSDYENDNYKSKLNDLILINRTIANGDLEVLFADNDEYIAQRKGTADNPGLIIYINRNSSELTRTVSTGWMNKDLHDYTNSIKTGINTNESGDAKLKAPSNGYSIWSLK